MKTTKNRIFTLLISFLLIFCVIWIYSENKALEINKISILGDKLPSVFSDFKIAQVSDLHNTEIGQNNELLIKMLKQSSPDIIAITGDMVDSRNADIEIALRFAKEAVKIAPCYYVNGNHEARVPKEYEKLKQGLKDAGVTILENETVDITIGEDSITLIGINDPGFRMELVDDTMEQNIAHQLMSVVPENDNYKVLLAHRPHYFDVYAGKVDLVLSGHAHGGQFRIPFIGGIIAPGQGLFPKYYEGSYMKENTSMVVSRGIGNSLFPFRINNPPEIVVTELVKLEK